MMKLFPNELPIHMPGVEPVLNVAPCTTNIVKETKTMPVSYNYFETEDTAFQAGKTYYIKKFGSQTYEETVDTTMNPKVIYFERETVPSFEATVTTVYDRYTDGFWTDIVNGNQVFREHPVEIIRTTTIANNATGEQFIERDHALGFWRLHKSLTYVPVCRRLEEVLNGESARIFR